MGDQQCMDQHKYRSWHDCLGGTLKALDIASTETTIPEQHHYTSYMSVSPQVSQPSGKMSSFLAPPAGYTFLKGTPEDNKGGESRERTLGKKFTQKACDSANFGGYSAFVGLFTPLLKED
jgi:hypothetical protein